MPLIYESSYSKRPFFLFNSYLETLYPYFTTKVHQVNYERERLELSDGDFLDLDWLSNGADKLIIVSHGFEGNSKDHFIEKSASYLSEKGYDILVWHYRSCGGELNRLPRFYHHGDIQDLAEVVNHATKKGAYNSVMLLGFSMGGNLVINYLGSDLADPDVKGGVVFSTPLNLKESAIKLKKGFNKFLERSFFKKLKRKVEQKQTQFPDLIDKTALEMTKNLSELNEEVVLPLSGFTSLDEYCDCWSSLQFLTKINVPLLIINAKNDPFLSQGSYPVKFCETSKNIYLETPTYGGHTGFARKVNGELWYPQRIHSFFKEEIC